LGSLRGAVLVVVWVVGLSLIASTGESMNVALNSDPDEVDLSKLQSDSAFLARSTSVPPGTYTNLVVMFQILRSRLARKCTG
jgi:hypothetical protein